MDSKQDKDAAAARMAELVARHGATKRDPEGSIRAFATKVRLDEGTIRKTTKGRSLPETATLDKIQRALGYTHDQILGREPLPLLSPPEAAAVEEDGEVRNSRLILKRAERVEKAMLQVAAAVHAMLEEQRLMIEALRDEADRQERSGSTSPRSGANGNRQGSRA